MLLRDFARAIGVAIAVSTFGVGVYALALEGGAKLSPAPLPDPEVQALGKLPGTDCTLFRVVHVTAAGGRGESTYLPACPAWRPPVPEPLTCREIENLR